MSALMPSCVNCGGALDPLSLYPHVCQLGAQTQAPLPPLVAKSQVTISQAEALTLVRCNMKRFLAMDFDGYGEENVRLRNQLNQAQNTIAALSRENVVIARLYHDMQHQLLTEMSSGAVLANVCKSLQSELLRLKAKYEPDPPPAPNPWGKMFRGGVGAAIER